MTEMFVNLTPGQFQRAHDLSARRTDEGAAVILPKLVRHLRGCAEENGGEFDERRALNGAPTELRVITCRHQGISP